MGSHRQAPGRQGRDRRATVLAVTMVLVGVAVLVLAIVRADSGAPPVAASPSPVAPPPSTSVAGAAGSPGPFDGRWTGPLADPDTTTVDVRVTVDGPERATVVEVPALGCVYRGGDPVAAPGDPRLATAEVRTDGDRGPRCADAATIRLSPATEGTAADRVRYELLGSCDGTVCAPRRAIGVLRADRP